MTRGDDTTCTYTQFFEELIDDTHEVPQREVIVGHDTFYLVEFGKVSSIQCLIPEHAIN